MTRNRTIVATLAVAALLVTAGCLGTLGSANGAQPSTDAGADGDRSVTVQATGTVETQPDAAEIHLGVTVTAEDPKTVRDQLTQRVEELRSGLADAGVPEAQIRTVHYDVREDRGGREETDEQQYRGIHAFAVEVDDVDRVGTIIDAAVDAGATDVQRVRFTLSEETRDQLREEALRTAMSEARADAEVVADAADLELTGVAAASTGGSHVDQYTARAATEAADGAGTAVEPGPVTVSASVTVTFNASA
jgi:uncharacterized protein YggE